MAITILDQNDKQELQQEIEEARTLSDLTPEQQAQARDNIGAAPMSLFNIIEGDTVVHDMLESEKFTSGTLIDGGKRYDNETYSVTDFIDIADAKQIYCYFNAGSSESKYKLARFHFYTGNADDTYISTYGNTTEYEFTECDGIPCVEIAKPQNAKYMIVCLPTSAVNNQLHHLMFVKSVTSGVEIPGLIIPGEDSTDDISEEINGIIADKDSVIWEKGSLSATTGEFTIAVPASPYNTTEYIEIPKGRYCIEVDGVHNTEGEVTDIYIVCVYDENKNFVQNLSSARVKDFSLSNDVNYIRVMVRMHTINRFLLYDIILGKENVTALKADVVIPRLDSKVNTLWDKANRVGAINTGYVRGRRPLFAFIFDGEYDMNATFEGLFSQHNAPIGFAIQYTTTFANNSKEQYLEWERKGHEILVHGAYVLRERAEGEGGNDAYITDVAQGKQYIKDSYTTMRRNGFNPIGYIASGGELDREAYIPTIKRYYEWASTQYNHANNSQPHYVYGETKPYELWRYNMQETTLDRMKQAVDDAIAENSVLVFFGHAKSDLAGDNNHFTLENTEALLSYIEEKEADIVRPSEAIKDFFSVRYEELLSLLND